METTKMETIEKQINLATDSFLQNVEFEIHKTESIKKLNLWMISLSTGMQLFFFGKVDYSSIQSIGFLFFYITLGAFLYNAWMAVNIQRTAVKINIFETEYQQRLNFQRVILMSALDKRTIDLVADYDSAELVPKLMDLEYHTKEKELAKSIVLFGKKLNEFSEKPIMVSLITQFLAIALFFLFR